MAGQGDRFPGSARLHLVDGVALLRTEEQVFEEMLVGWRNQQLARNLALSTIEKRAGRLRAFVEHTGGAFPWQWTPQHADEWFGDLQAVRACAHSTLRSYQDALRSFCAYVADLAYDWISVCEQRFGTHPIQVVHEWDTAAHVQKTESRPNKRAFTVDELQDFLRLRRRAGDEGPRSELKGLVTPVPGRDPGQDRV
ncbi:hypothetical protein EV192_12084 [Actinocrispum wychmicini]|uniref:Core-binding (CB) domain-containing protein n=1 Tax=Actinocrispum wychmicini TaxID=1213861 RepID=A0A4R2IPH9_9PSEU|nr:hypothetical protein EV192_12084 [Actinocrispum wychmicini]